MRLKEDQTNYQASSVRRRIARQSKPQDGPPRPVRGKKDRKRWCGGHVGREHTPVCRNYRDVKRPMQGVVLTRDFAAGWKLLVCTTCGKELDSYMPWSPLYKHPPPDWAKDAAPA